MTKTNKRTITSRILILLAVLSVIGGLSFAYLSNNDKTSPTTPTPTIATSSVVPVSADTWKADWNKNYEINQEYVGVLHFESDLITQNVVKAWDNEKYLKLTWDLQESSQGAIFLDYRNSVNDQNMIIYGHYVYKDESAMFGPLHELTKEENYEENKYIQLQLQNETRRYEVAYVYFYEMNNSKLEYYHPNYDAVYFDEYQKTIKAKSFYDTGITLIMEDKLLTLQTCVRNRDDLRLIIVAKQVD